MMGVLEGKVAAITGAGRGIGREVAIMFAREGAKVVVNDLGGATDGAGASGIADEVTAEIIKHGGEAIAHREDIATVAGGQSLLNTAVEHFGGLDILVNNAGILRDRTLFNMEEEDWDAVIRVHLKGHYCCSRPFVRYIRDQGRSHCRIINFSSVSGLFGNFGQANYGAAKAGIAGFSRVLALELAKYGCTVNTISPAALTRMTIPLRERRGETVSDQDLIDSGPHHIAPVVTWLASEAAGHITNQIFHAAHGLVGIMQQPALIASFQQERAWTLEELDEYMPKLMHAKKEHDKETSEAGKPVMIKEGWGSQN
ncbi:MAG: SDR family NAD(P)-dependent oxidoreductase [Gammaproteobacteria bacterium]|nr:SDR family NAD(P)-dependent oxidoreductase [Gammaproteobacteria bacterium]